jgi:glycosyltransferase involved in cell wall biosynthesis
MMPKSFARTADSPLTRLLPRAAGQQSSQPASPLSGDNSTGSGAKIVVLDPSCTNLRGHHFHSVLDLVRAVRPAQPAVVVNREMQPSLSLGDLKVYRLFQRSIYDNIYAGLLGGKPQRKIQRHLWKLKRSVLQMQLQSRLQWPELHDAAEHVSLHGADHIVLPTAETDLILELLSYLQERGGLQPLVHARIVSVDNHRQSLEALDRLFRRLSKRAALSKRLHLYVEMPAMRRFMMRRYSVPIDLYPYLLSLPPKDGGRTLRRSAGKKPVTFGFLGTARAEKGFERLLPIITAVSANGSFDPQQVAFLVQLDHESARLEKQVDRMRSALKRLASERGIGIRLVEGTLSSETYAELFDEIDCLLLPYSGNRYRLSGSGILFEALMNAKPFICSAGLSFSDYAREGNAVEASDDAAFAAAILEVASKFELFQEGARRAEHKYRSALVQLPLLQRLQTSRATAAAA